MQCNGIWKVHCCQYLTYFAVYMTGGERVALPIGAMSATNPRSVQIVSASSGNNGQQTPPPPKGNLFPLLEIHSDLWVVTSVLMIPKCMHKWYSTLNSSANESDFIYKTYK